MADHAHHLCNFDSLCSREFPAWKCVLHFSLPSSLPSSSPPSPLSSSTLIEQTIASACTHSTQHSIYKAQVLERATSWSHDQLCLQPLAPLLSLSWLSISGTLLAMCFLGWGTCPSTPVFFLQVFTPLSFTSFQISLKCHFNEAFPRCLL